MPADARLQESLSLLLVGAVWGCTNPFLRKGSAESVDGEQLSSEQSAHESSKTDSTPEEDVTSQSFESAKKTEKSQSLLNSLSCFRRFAVWFPYMLNQGGSLLYYKLLAGSDLTLSVPICNSLALVFSSLVSFLLGERLDKPLRAGLGAALVTVGVAVCILSNHGGEGDDTPLSSDEL